MSNSVEVTVNYEKRDHKTGLFVFSHSYTNTWLKTPMYCVICGKQGLYEQQGGGDYYAGDSYMCVNCGANWSMDAPSGGPCKDKYDLQVFEQLKAFEATL